MQSDLVNTERVNLIMNDLMIFIPISNEECLIYLVPT